MSYSANTNKNGVVGLREFELGIRKQVSKHSIQASSFEPCKSDMIGPDDGFCPEQNDRINEDNRPGFDLIARSVSVFYNSFTKNVCCAGSSSVDVLCDEGDKP
jgi:hypothetical protein